MEDVWKALSGAQPWHLEMREGWEEKCYYEGLRHVTPPWPLKSVHISSYGGGDGHWEDPRRGEGEAAALARTKPSFPACYNNIETLSLNAPYCGSLFFYPEGRAQKLRSLTIRQNYAITTFVYTIACNPALIHTLQNLTIALPWCTGGTEIDKMRKFIQESRALKKLELFLTKHSGWGADAYEASQRTWADEHQYAVFQEGAPYLGLYACLPSTLEYLSLRLPATLFSEVDMLQWLEKARDHAWLPNLKEMAFSVEADFKGNNADNSKKHRLGKGQQKELKAMIEMFKEVMKGRGVKIGRVRGDVEMMYPLPIS
ncbi:hypothetical protein NMY22_g20067 [Coprinellus aureogranulatus]|nr:hypothetical protein NMY22_g20067 [Coprinellus aureogranulatus]